VEISNILSPPCFKLIWRSCNFLANRHREIISAGSVEVKTHVDIMPRPGLQADSLSSRFYVAIVNLPFLSIKREISLLFIGAQHLVSRGFVEALG
jgi:hypothetical protein